VEVTSEKNIKLKMVKQNVMTKIRIRCRLEYKKPIDAVLHKRLGIDAVKLVQKKLQIEIGPKSKSKVSKLVGFSR
jgi:phosphotransferase system IIB component